MGDRMEEVRDTRMKFLTSELAKAGKNIMSLQGEADKLDAQLTSYTDGSGGVTIRTCIFHNLLALLPRINVTKHDTPLLGDVGVSPRCVRPTPTTLQDASKTLPKRSETLCFQLEVHWQTPPKLQAGQHHGQPLLLVGNRTSQRKQARMPS